MFDVTLLILLGLAALGFISHNTTVAVSILVLIIVRVTPLSTFFTASYAEKVCLTAFFKKRHKKNRKGCHTIAVIRKINAIM